MKTPVDERRKYQRAFFSMESNIITLFSILGTKAESIEAMILNISPGGVFFAITGNYRRILKKGDRILFHKFHQINDPIEKINLEAEIVWIMDDPSFHYMGVGTKFINITESTEEFVNNLISLWQGK